jgi:Mn-dependent DtxR family transcriptional regulator
MTVQESGEMYLETIYVLTMQGKSIRAIDVCEHMGYSKPSVSRAVSLLKKGGYLTVEEGGSLCLTQKGKQRAENTYQRHTVLTEFFTLLGVDKTVASDDACRIEHHISDQTVQALKRHVQTLKK